MKSTRAAVVLSAFLLLAAGHGEASTLSPQAEQAAAAQTLAALAALGPATESPSVEVPGLLGRALDLAALGPSHKVILQPAVGVASTPTRAVFEYWPQRDKFFWKLTLFNIQGFIGAHLHNGPKFNGPIAVDLFPKGATFVADAQAKSAPEATYNGVFADGDFAATGYTGDYNGFLGLIRAGKIYVNVHTLANRDGLVQAYLREV